MVNFMTKNFNYLVLMLTYYTLMTCNTCFGMYAVRDTETEEVFSKFVIPMFDAAHIDHKLFQIWVIDDPSINAYVTNNASIFVTRGMIEFSDDPYVISGVFAHEIGHILAHHGTNRLAELSRILDYMKLGFLIGMITAFSVSPDLGSAIGLGSYGVSNSALMSYSRVQESIADQYALDLLDKVGYKTFGLKKMLGYFMITDSVDSYYKYFASHPASKERLSDVTAYVQKSDAHDFSPELITLYKRMRAKILAYFRAASFVECSSKEPSVECRYMDVILLYRNADTKMAIKLLDDLIAQYPYDPYFHELKGQILYKLGEMESSVNEYRIALKYLKYDPFLIKFEMVKSLNYTSSLDAINLINELLEKDYKNPALWYELSLAYKNSKSEGMMHCSLAFKDFYEGNYSGMMREVGYCRELLPQDDKFMIKVNDMLHAYQELG